MAKPRETTRDTCEACIMPKTDIARVNSFRIIPDNVCIPSTIEKKKYSFNQFLSFYAQLSFSFDIYWVIYRFEKNYPYSLEHIKTIRSVNSIMIYSYVFFHFLHSGINIRDMKLCWLSFQTICRFNS